MINESKIRLVLPQGPIAALMNLHRIAMIQGFLFGYKLTYREDKSNIGLLVQKQVVQEMTFIQNQGITLYDFLCTEAIKGMTATYGTPAHENK